MANEENGPFTEDEIARAQSYKVRDYPEGVDPQIDELVKDLISGFADKWTMIILDVLWEEGTLRFSELARHVTGISQKMLTQTLRRMERDGLVIRTLYPSVPPKVEYRLSSLGLSLGAAFCNIWVWAIENLESVRNAREDFDSRK
ncbi:winged helix-turn-helix transcriptional regulator [Rhodospirillaceae bacterium SYSU D60014]|uniref:winged helix-turn-helix transcriptional regulator n=1 Tax=Virgifigura deserti TaxID=2268457 RepID=UPI000E666F67